mmetsp:Transcript_78311/g.221431  ORF Transcript_78311/g.221431 Transcript_78311/m.221431 type:complete len:138 (+) Transcript_78311:64-477(+)|eukprot:CAMPEP_0179253038 /NCGR_PEP_ID=MMETSP0797-20121207/22520_1 /TAXON_ID=47934 /ORGANISM="Dinophysis acuminata, Strain DAEP01" /LENGTH=137 /DNA_ID=CAMNT_0020960879 /DNA_START=64 /DNA_END=477 /DNA_ORIENTATION=-
MAASAQVAQPGCTEQRAGAMSTLYEQLLRSNWVQKPMASMCVIYGVAIMGSGVYSRAKYAAHAVIVIMLILKKLADDSGISDKLKAEKQERRDRKKKKAVEASAGAADSAPDAAVQDAGADKAIRQRKSTSGASKEE